MLLDDWSLTLAGWTLLIATVTSVACALCGSILFIGRKSMVSEGLSHAVLPGLVIAFAYTRDYSSPSLIMAAAFSGLLMVWLTQLIERSGLVDNDAGLGIVFAAMFSVGILIVNAKLKSTHFHADCIIDGNLALAPLERLVVGNRDFGPEAFVVMVIVLAIVAIFLGLAYKELKLGIFDPVLAQQFGLRPTLVQFVWLGIVSITTVAAFEVAGSILIVALMIAPPAAAYLLTDRLSRLLFFASIIAIASSFLGYYLARAIDISPTGPISSMAGLLFLLTLCFAPRKGLLAAWTQQRSDRSQTNRLLVLHSIERNGRVPKDQFNIADNRIERYITQLCDSGLIRREASQQLKITDAGRSALREVFDRQA
ncbi:MAG: metal ABC transporter permease [Planctomycetota bacterium]